MTAVMAGWRARHRASDEATEVQDPATKARRQATVVAAVAATVPTVLAAEGMATLAVDLLGFPVVAAVALASFLELALVSSALLARAAALAGRPGGRDALAVWVVSAVSGLLAGVHELVAAAPDGSTRWTLDPGSMLAGAVRLVAPLVAAWLWARVLEAARAEQAERTVAEVRRDRRLLDVGMAALAVRRLVDAGVQDSKRIGRAARKLDRAHIAALRVAPPAPSLLDVLAAVGQVDHLPAATVVAPPAGRPPLVAGQTATAVEHRPDSLTARVVEDDSPALFPARMAGQVAESDSQHPETSDTLALAVEVVRTDPSVSGARLADELTARGRRVSTRSGQRWRTRALAALAAGA